MATRLDILLTERGLCPSREKAQALIIAGEVWSNGQRLDKPGTKVADDCPLELRSETLRFVSRAGEKLEAALEHFQVSVENKVALDVGASTGGFTDCLLKRGASHVCSVDVGYGQLDTKLRSDPRVSVMERQNARYLTLGHFPKPEWVAQIGLVVVDVSFISLRTILPPVRALLRQRVEWLLLFKPQFEVGRKEVGKGGLVRNPIAVQSALTDLDLFLQSLKFEKKNAPIASPLPGKKSGNVEYLLHYETHAT